MTGSPNAEGPHAAVFELLGEYARLTGGVLEPVGDNLYEFTPSLDDKALFGHRETIRLAFAVEALESDASSEMAILGSGFFRRLIEAIRLRGHRMDLGFATPQHHINDGAQALAVPVHGATATPAASELAWVPLGWLIAHVAMRAGSELEEALGETNLLDLSTGSIAGFDPALATATHSGPPVDAPRLPIKSLDSLVGSMLGHLEETLRKDITAVRTNVGRSLDHELARLQRYYTTVENERRGDPKSKPEHVEAIRREHALRRGEQIERHQVRCVVKPFQLKTLYVLAQTATWRLTAEGREDCTIRSTRFLTGPGQWELACPACSTGNPEGLHVCIQSHVSCDRCTDVCSVCDQHFCSEHGIAACHIDGSPACDQHSELCEPCGGMYCFDHRVMCDRGKHPVCASCAGPCGVCGTVTCTLHGQLSDLDAPMGVRRLCQDCVRSCEGGAGEVVGKDEVVGCATCERVICRNHEVRCEVDNAAHCSTHLNRTDRSRRLICQAHRARCFAEPEYLFGTDEVTPCYSCGKVSCDTHGASCYADGLWHCRDHLRPVADKKGALACDEHRSVCHIDNVSYSFRAVSRCPVCDRDACRDHRSRCDWCEREVCEKDLVKKRCRTCNRMSPLTDADDDLIAAWLDIKDAKWGRPAEWFVAVDGAHRVVEVALSWRQTLVFSVPHGLQVPEIAVVHGLLGRKRIRSG